LACLPIRRRQAATIHAKNVAHPFKHYKPQPAIKVASILTPIKIHINPDCIRNVEGSKRKQDTNP
jgi:hypothetical protein